MLVLGRLSEWWRFLDGPNSLFRRMYQTMFDKPWSIGKVTRLLFPSLAGMPNSLGAVLERPTLMDSLFIPLVVCGYRHGGDHHGQHRTEFIHTSHSCAEARHSHHQIQEGPDGLCSDRYVTLLPNTTSTLTQPVKSFRHLNNLYTHSLNPWSHLEIWTTVVICSLFATCNVVQVQGKPLRSCCLCWVRSTQRDLEMPFWPPRTAPRYSSMSMH